MEELSVWRYQVTVSFDPATRTMHLDGFDGDRILRVRQGISIIVFHLITQPPSVPEAQFPTYPFVWFETNDVGHQTPIDQPKGFQVVWYNPLQCTLIITNSDLYQNSEQFDILVFYNGETYGTDPTIINLPPDSPG